MKQLRTNALPDRLTQFRSLQSSFSASWNVRAGLLAQMNGYPVPSQVLAYVFRYLKLGDLNATKRGIMSLRDCARYAAEVLTNVPHLKIDRYQLELREVHDYVTTHATDFGFRHLKEDDLMLVAYLITSAEVQATSWRLDFQPSAEDNLVINLLKMYTAASVPAPSPSISFSKGEGVVIEHPEEENQSIYYVANGDRFETLASIIIPEATRKTIGIDLAALSDSKVRKQRITDLTTKLENESVIYHLADLRLIDHLLMLLTDVNVWSLFVSPRSKIDSAQNVERANGLKVLAGYLQALLAYPHMLRFELFREGYFAMESWHGSFPTVPADILANYELYVRKYDILNAKGDASALYSAYQTESDPNLKSRVYVQFVELTHMYGVEEITARINDLSRPPSKLRFDNLSELKGPHYDHLLLSYPTERFTLLDDIQGRLMERARFETISKSTYNAISPGYARYYNDEILDRLAALNPRVPFSWHQSVPCSYNFDRGAVAFYTSGTFGIRYLAPWATAINEYQLRTKEIYQIGTAHDLMSRYSGLVATDTTLATDLRVKFNRTWRSFYPANLMPGDRLDDPRSISASPIALEHLFESMSNESYAFIRKDLMNPFTLEIRATYLSSFCLLFRKTPAMDTAVLVEGVGMPYGITYSALSAMQQFVDKTDLIKLPDLDLYIGFLKKVPLPGDALGIAETQLKHPYYFFHGNGQILDVEKLTSGEALLHMSLRPIRPLKSENLTLFDKWYAYDNDTLYLQVDTKASYATILDTNEVWTAPIKEDTWRGDKTMTQLHFFNFGNYSGASTPGVSPLKGDESTKVQQLIAEMDRDIIDSHANTTIAKAPSGQSEVINEAEVASSINEKKGSEAGGKRKEKKPSSAPNPGPSEADGEPETSPLSTAGDKKGRPEGAIGEFLDPKTGGVVYITPREGESPDDAITRVSKHHEVNSTDVTRY